jgi:phage tail sheath protein FI
MVNLNTDKKDPAFVVVDTPARLTPDGTSVQAWATNANNAPSNGEQGLITASRYAGVYYPWGLATNLDGTEIFVPPSTAVLRTIAFNDQVAYPWFAPAGFNRGLVTAFTSVGYLTSENEYQPVQLNQGQRDVLYENRINPIAFIAGRGLVIYGQKTRSPVESALNRVNVARLVNYLNVQLDNLAKPFLFEPNDQYTRDAVTQTFESFLGDMVALRAVYDFAVLCDETNNTPDRIDRNELWIDIAIKPVKAIEFIYIPLRILNTGDPLPP